MTDIVKRLRNPIRIRTDYGLELDRREAADEIERLRRLLLRMRPCLHAQWKAEIDAALSGADQPDAVAEGAVQDTPNGG